MTETTKQKREELKAISRVIKQLVKVGRYDSVNEGLANLYAEQGHTEIHSFKKWLELGFCVKKGEKALLLWGQPKRGQNQQKKSDDENDEFKFFPLAYVFSQKQVQPVKELAR